MGKKRKRPIKGDRALDRLSQPCTSPASTCFKGQRSLARDDAAGHSHPVISLYYSQVLTLRQYLLRQIPLSSKSRRRRIVSIRHEQAPVETNDDGGSGQLASFLDTTLIGILTDSHPTCNEKRRQELAAFTQSQSRSEQTSTDTGPACAQAELVDFVISSLFSRDKFSRQRPLHLLTRGFRRESVHPAHRKRTISCSISGLEVQFPNDSVQQLKRAPWTEVLGLLGDSGEEIMLKLLLDCGIFVAVDQQRGIYFQLSGLPLSTLEPVNKVPQSHLAPKNALSSVTSNPGPAPDRKETKMNTSTSDCKPTTQKPAPIVFHRRRILYASPVLDSKGKIQFGMKSHVLNRFPSSTSLAHTTHVLKYIFPKQFGLHNVFSSVSNGQDIFKDYAYREDEIAKLEKAKRAHSHSESMIPRRLQGKAVELVQQLQNRNKHCSYAHLLNYYCPAERTGPWKLGPEPFDDNKLSTSESLITQSRLSCQQASSSIPDGSPSVDPSISDMPKLQAPKLSLTDYATPASSVSAFCRAVMKNLIPPQFYGTGQNRILHQDKILKHVDQFVQMRRFENLSLQDVCQGIKVTCIPWLEPPSNTRQALSPLRHKLSRSDFEKRTELLHEFVYYLFDSILIPLIRANFYVTESQSGRNRLFYFRHDVWYQLTERPILELKAGVFEELEPATAQRVVEKRLEKSGMGYGSLRLLPKSTGIRPLLNLKRKPVLAGHAKSGKFWSVNSVVAPIHSMLQYEKTRAPSKLGSCVQSVGEIYSQLKNFKRHLQNQGSMPPLYFVKLDIQSCFDTIPQQSLVHLIERLITEAAYHYTKHVEMTPSDEFNILWPSHERPSKARRRFVGRAAPAARPQHLAEAVTNGETSQRRNTVFVDTLMQREFNAEDLLDLLDDHVRNNLIKFGRNYFRQCNGIPQGSVLSSMLCNLFYADMEQQVLGFLQSDNALLVRLVDDFLLVTTESSLAMRFLQVMIPGQPAYGVSVNPAKSLVNFAAAVEGIQVPRLVDTRLFPYCGCLIDTRSLEIYKDHERILEGGQSVATSLSNSLTVELTRVPGRTLHRKLLGSFKLLMHPMYLDRQHNTIGVILSNLYANFVISGMKMYRYLKSSGQMHPAPGVVIRIIRDMIHLATRMVQARREANVPAAAGRGVHHCEVEFLAAAAFRFVLGRKQARYVRVLGWLDVILRESQPNSQHQAWQLGQVVRTGNATYGGWKF
ncbi:telomerase reverse transcriptase [Aspergillus luchuensis]|uniref:Telomerase reverse transcriptase n=2 Tax=Aspergillus kawachii TaxID=1069201 RepID=A0A7R7W2F0_ASPKA|nr:uncharacterized protein AKAW2_20096S [Aspergillus luchuensis]BCR95156.1 hypothetical protein AKAW2_20096S [Aspergillus luchuensis]BCS07722.1 hypothetical protein ALUC_20092S [Aspergillus luchuensis]GAA89680.1 telomerase reverse transcriptase [Aspergillus luchuensis IFO 4308]